MAKQYRGKSLARNASRTRGICPICFATRTKLLYKRKKDDGTTLTVCKKCMGASQEKLNAAVELKQPLAYRRKHRKTFNQFVHLKTVKESS